MVTWAFWIEVKYLLFLHERVRNGPHSNTWFNPGELKFHPDIIVAKLAMLHGPDDQSISATALAEF